MKNKHQEPIQRGLEDFCREYTGRETGWHVETWLHPITKSVQAAIVVPEFEQLGFTERLKVLSGYLMDHLPTEHFVHLSLKMPLTPEEYEDTDWRPSVPTLSLAAT
jgi:hypothetical protein